MINTKISERQYNSILVCAREHKIEVKKEDVKYSYDGLSEYFIKINSETFIYSLDKTMQYPNDVPFYASGDFVAELMKFEDYSEETEEIIDAHYNSLDELKEIHPENWKQVVLEIKFRELAHMEEI